MIKIGDIYKTNNFGDIKIVERIKDEKRSDRWIVEFLKTGTRVETYSHNINRGSIKDYFQPTTCGIGYLGELGGKAGSHPMKTVWEGMIGRCYNKENKDYCGKTTVCERWHNFTNFVEDVEKLPFYDKRLSEGGRKWQLDKDILGRGKMEYSPENCIWIPAQMNSCVGGIYEMINMGFKIEYPEKEEIIDYIKRRYL